MRWHLFRKVEYYPFDVTLVARGYVGGKNKVLRWRFKNVFFYFDGKVEYSFRGRRDLAECKSFLKRNLDRAFVVRVGREIRKSADAFLTVTQRAWRNQQSLRANLTAFYQAHARLVTVFQTPELAQHLVPDKKSSLLRRFGMDRDYAARQLVKSEAIYRRQLPKIVNLPRQAAFCLLPDELKLFLATGLLPKDIKRRRRWAILRQGREERMFWNQAADCIFKREYLQYLVANDKRRELAGQAAYPGLVRGRVYVALSDQDFKHIPQRAILVCSITRYSVVPYLKRVQAIVTDQGGVTCHAAIIAREFKIPTVIGTHNATDIFKTGDRIEVDAEKGIVRKIS